MNCIFVCCVSFMHAHQWVRVQLQTAQNGIYEGSWDRDLKLGALAGSVLYPNGDM